MTVKKRENARKATKGERKIGDISVSSRCARRLPRSSEMMKSEVEHLARTAIS